MALDDEHGATILGETAQPPLQQLVQRVLADTNRRVGPDLGKGDRWGHGVGIHDSDLGESQPPCVVRAEITGPFVDIDSPDRRVGMATRQSHRDRPRTTAEIEKIASRHRRVGSGSPVQQQRRSRVESAMAEHAGIGGQLEGVVAHMHGHGEWRRSRPRCGREVLARVGFGLAWGPAVEGGV